MRTFLNHSLVLILTAALFVSCASSNEENMSPEEFAKHVSDLIVDGTQFEFEPALQEFEQDGLHLIDFPDNGSGVYYARTVVEVDGIEEQDFDTYFGITNQAGKIEVYLDGELIYTKTSQQDGHFEYVDYGLFEYEDRIKVSLKDGTHQLAFKYRPDKAGNNRIYFNFVRSTDGLNNTVISLRSPAEEEELQHYGYWWIGPFSNDAVGSELLDVSLTADELVAQEFKAANGSSVRWDIPKLHLVKGLPGWLTFQNWHYSGGTFLDAMKNVGDHYDGLNYQQYITEHMSFLKTHIDEIEQMRKDYGLIESPFGHYFRFSLLDDMGMQTVPYVNALLAEAPEDRDRNSFEFDLAERVADHMMNDASRLPDGTFARYTPDSMSVWADDLFMSSIFLLKYYELTGDQEYLDEVVDQVLSFDSYLIDEPTKLYWHGYFSGEGKHSSSKWGRANGWTIMAKVELLLVMPEDHPKRADVMKAFTRHCEGLLAVQSNDGRWHQVLDDPASYLETSATAMFVRGFARGVAEGWLDRATYAPAIEKGWASLTHQFDEEGNVIGIVRGTPILFSDAEYDNWGTRLNDPRGLGALLYASIAVDLYRNGAQ